jgi:hypothetical protein
MFPLRLKSAEGEIFFEVDPMQRTATETMIACMEEIETCTDIIIIGTHTDGSLMYHSNSETASTKLGLVEFCKQLIIARAFKDE